ncbi:MAG: bifunctional indole-3-glycerol phosphate synthase/phosphoribosylanthranilate isomerase [Acidobacteria bacterium]|nr:MAG: bifunctional indole-3-glycerol phosphate synthase/phosphoribosylanthranilate isomerase [Acidobacteriota bacterium]
MRRVTEAGAPTVLASILSAKRRRLEAGEIGGARPAGPRPDGERFESALAGPGPRVIAEIKHRSPSAGTILEGAGSRVADVARAYRRGGASAISVVVEQDFFGGDPAWIPVAKGASGLPVLMKDFVVDERQLDQAAALGADAVLLVVAALGDEELRRLHAAASARGLAVLVEAHDAAEAERAAAAGARLVGVNARDLRTFRVDLDAMARLGRSLPSGAIRVAESGIRDARDVRRLCGEGYGAFLVGESLLRSGDPARALRRLVGLGSTEVKVCGLTRAEDVRSAVSLGVDWVGLNLSPLSPRRVSLEAAGALAEAAAGAGVVLVVAGNAPEEVARAVERVRPAAVQLHEPPSPAATAPGVPLWQAVRVGRDDLDAAALWPGERFVLDAARPGQAGGTGTTFDWSVAASRRWGRPVVLAGGLTPGNVAEAVRRVRPACVDVASGVESAPGVKDAARMEAFVAAVRGVPDPQTDEGGAG